MSLETFSLSVDHSVDDLDLSPCFQPNQFLSQFTRFPSGRRSEEVKQPSTVILILSISIRKANFLLFRLIGTAMCLHPET